MNWLDRFPLLWLVVLAPRLARKSNTLALIRNTGSERRVIHYMENQRAAPGWLPPWAPACAVPRERCWIFCRSRNWGPSPRKTEQR